MITILHLEWNMLDRFWLCAFLAMVPVILAAGALEQSAPSMVLPDEQSYRAPLSGTLFDASEWRTPPPPDAGWRQPRAPSLDWRTNPPPQPKRSPTRKSIELFPRYQPGNPYDFDPITREEKPQIKVFEFGS